ncbi:hypothetical protein [Polaromonas sp.]
MRNILSATARYFTGRPLLVSFMTIGIADTIGKAAAAALGTT